MPELRKSKNRDPDVVVRYGDVDPPEGRGDKWGGRTIKNESGIITFWMDRVGGLEAHHGREIIIAPSEGAEERGFRFLVAGIGLGLILHQRNLSSLHASAAVVGDGVVAFIGGKGMGKSTTVAAFHRAGCPVVTDDVLPYQIQAGGVEALPAFPSLKLFSDSVEAVFGEDPGDSPRIDPRGDKRTREVRDGFSEEALPIRCIYVLDWKEPETNLESSKMVGKEACLELLRNSFALRILKTGHPSTDELHRLSRLTERVPVKRLARPHDLNLVDQIPGFIERDLAESTRSGVEMVS
jgi:hypothetical protein